MTDAALFELLSLECRVDPYGAISYHNRDGQLHRVYGPAIEYTSGSREWCQNDTGPAIYWPDGYRAWCQNGLLHRLDGPAIEYGDGRYEWHINGNQLTEAEWQQAVASMETV